MKETVLPPQEAFYDNLTEEDIKDDDYQFAQEVSNRIVCQTMQDFHDVCLYTDVLLLADMFERFRSVCMKSYDLDPAHYHTAPGLACDACLKYTKIELRTLHDKDMHMFLERGMRGGISMITHRSSPSC